ncbi:uncharacterized protein RHOBADRAFT_47044 [Rhodotorula graminis WP1]|uniref:HMG box domain-containing protein n=1 Tax=Rhodotorula graminis (strain WP1) TaxID=578459 RepID=A0A0P9EKJ0_RHOGW|nr:uncharacterized protein RHOBADRAFT_47044 [Rhodotorula graminis WP1]KPV72199.1 hypothetical protein RHOBADRAFT_47044 [Rhodotorula graminis WP1]
MAKTTTKKKSSPKASDSGSKKKKSGSGGQPKRALSDYQKFYSETIADLKENEPDMDGQQRRKEASRLWAEHKENHKEN